MVPTWAYAFYEYFRFKDRNRCFENLLMIHKGSQFVCFSILQMDNQVKACHQNVFDVLISILRLQILSEFKRHKLRLILWWTVNQAIWCPRTFDKIISEGNIIGLCFHSLLIKFINYKSWEITVDFVLPYFDILNRNQNVINESHKDHHMFFSVFSTFSSLLAFIGCF